MQVFQEGGGFLERELNRLWKKRLWSYYYLISEMKINKEIKLFLDSGAFSAWSQNTEIDIKEYIDFIKKNKEYIYIYANLDVIGDPKATWQNQMIMEKKGLNPLPTFHYGEEEKWLKRYLCRGYDYIALGGMVPISTNDLKKWLDRLFGKILTDERGMPIVKVHGYGITSLSLLLRYPWYSVDSSSWVMTSRTGSIYVPRRKNGQWVYNENPWVLAVSNRSTDQKKAGRHYLTLTPKQKEIVLLYLKEKGYCIGRSEYKKVLQSYQLKENERWADLKPKDSIVKREVEIIVEGGICNRYQLRDELNILYFLDLEKSMPKWPTKFLHKNKQGLL